MQLPGEVDQDEARELADEILSRSQYREEEPSLAERALDWLAELLGRLFEVVLGATGGYWVGYLIIGVALAVAVYLAWRYLPRRLPAGPGAAGRVEQEIRATKTRRYWLDQAAEAEANGQWARAVHARYHALTSGLADHEQLSPDPSTTSGEHRARFGESEGSAPDQVERFNAATDCYEQVWFGGTPAGEPDARHLERTDDELVE